MKIRRAFKRTLRDERGSFSIEAILMFPLLAWAFMAMFVFFEGLRESNINLKATYTVSDLLSRETDEIDDAYLNGMNNIYAWLSRSQGPVQMRLTVVRYDEATNSHIIQGCARGINGKPSLEQADIATVVSPHVPIMADASIAIVVEAWATYTPIVDMGLSETELYNIVVTSPRFSDQLKCAGDGDGTGSTHDDGDHEEQPL